jgi:hypothetical protein
VKTVPTGTTLIEWPESVARDRTLITFGIALKSAIASSNWARTTALLTNTLSSLINQTDDRFRILICGHEMPVLPQSRKIEFIRANWIPSPDKRDFILDKQTKRLLLGRRLRQVGGGLYMQLDADDILHRDIVHRAHNSSREGGVVITKGWVLDYSNGVIAPVPGAWSVDIDRVCGSTAITRFAPEEIVDEWPPDGSSPSMFSRAGHHAYIRALYDEHRRPLEEINWPSVIYVVNSGENLSFALNRTGARETGLLQNILDHRVTDRNRLRTLSEEFGLDLQPLQ